MAERVYKWHWDCGRMGSVEGLFVATEEAVAAAIGQDVYLGEVLGKHSEVQGTLEEKEFTPLSDNEAVIAFVQEHGPFGFNPLSYVGSEDNGISALWCHSCEQPTCHSCAGCTYHETCDPIVDYEKRGEAPV